MWPLSKAARMQPYGLKDVSMTDVIAWSVPSETASILDKNMLRLVWFDIGSRLR